MTLATSDLPVRPVDAAAAVPATLFSVCTLVTDADQYREMVASLAAGGFAEDCCEYLYLDNRGANRWDAYSGLARLIGLARGRYVILCHQDIRLLADGAAALLARLAELDRLAPCWALAGNAGGTPDGRRALRITDPDGADQRVGSLPARAVSLDENFIVLRRDGPVGLSRDLSGFHFYGTDLCVQAAMAGRSAWVIDFHLHHLGGSLMQDPALYDAQARFEAKYAALLGRSRLIRTTCTKVRLAASAWARLVAAVKLRRYRGRARVA